MATYTWPLRSLYHWSTQLHKEYLKTGLTLGYPSILPIYSNLRLIIIFLCMYTHIFTPSPNAKYWLVYRFVYKSKYLNSQTICYRPFRPSCPSPCNGPNMIISLVMKQRMIYRARRATPSCNPHTTTNCTIYPGPLCFLSLRKKYSYFSISWWSFGNNRIRLIVQKTLICCRILTVGVTLLNVTSSPI